MKVKTITITDVQEEWIHENSVSLSRFVQKCIDKKMGVVTAYPVLEDV